jgi:signal transduction histidine kinase
VARLVLFRAAMGSSERLRLVVEDAQQLATRAEVLQNARVTPARRALVVWAAMVAAVGGVFLLAYLDLRREQAHALDDFTIEQITAARALSATVSARFDAAHAIDINRLFAAVSGAPTRLIIVDDTGRWLVREPDAAAEPHWQAPSAASGEIGALVAAMTHGDNGSLFLQRESADQLGLGARRAVAGFAPIALGDKRWSVAVVTSAARVRDRARLAGGRLAVTTVGAALIVGLFGTLIARQRRRAQSLAEALRLAEATQALQRDLIRAEKLATIGTLAAGVAHEIGTPLGIISGRAEALLAKASDEATKKALSSIIAQVDKVSTTIRQLLDFSRLRPVEAGAVPPAQALSSAAALLEHRFKSAKVELSVDAAPTVPPMLADPGQLEQVLVNLLMNACDACQPGGHVVARAAEGSDGVRVDIVDDGVGIPAENLGAVLDPFFTTKKRGQGTGLGLTIAADIVKNHGGSLELESTVGVGTTVHIVLPRAS